MIPLLYDFRKALWSINGPVFVSIKPTTDLIKTDQKSDPTDQIDHGFCQTPTKISVGERDFGFIRKNNERKIFEIKNFSRWGVKKNYVLG